MLRNLWSNWNVVIILAASKLTLHLFFNTNYGFHRDEYLHLAIGEHLAWGYMEVPPVIAVLGKLILGLGGSLFVTRLFPAIIGAVTIVLLGMMVRDLGGKKWAQLLAGLAFLISPAFLRSNTLFQPVTFNQFFWLLSAFLIVRLIKTESPKYWYYLGLIAGLGFLTKYSIVFFYAAFILAIFLTPQRKWLKTKYPYVAIGIAFLVALPNLVWQYQHNIPVVQHMTELYQTQLINVDARGFLKAQLMTHHAALVIWMSGLIYLFYSQKLSAYRILGWIFIGTILLLLLFSGKSYYTLGAYPMLMAIGGVAIEDSLNSKKAWLNPLLISSLIAATIPVLPYGIPVLPIKNMEQYCAFMKDKFSYDGPLYWEDGKLHSLPQDYADMHGWEEMAAKVSRVYHDLSPTEQQSCLLYGGSYSHVSSLNYYRRKYDLPEVYSLHGSHLMWAPDSINIDREIMIDDVSFDQSSYFNNIQLVDSIQNRYAREPGYIYYLTDPQVDLNRGWADLVASRKKTYNFR